MRSIEYEHAAIDLTDEQRIVIDVVFVGSTVDALDHCPTVSICEELAMTSVYICVCSRRL